MWHALRSLSCQRRDAGCTFRQKKYDGDVGHEEWTAMRMISGKISYPMSRLLRRTRIVLGHELGEVR
jgi:hypothetical protein